MVKRALATAVLAVAFTLVLPSSGQAQIGECCKRQCEGDCCWCMIHTQTGYGDCWQPDYCVCMTVYPGCDTKDRAVLGLDGSVRGGYDSTNPLSEPGVSGTVHLANAEGQAYVEGTRYVRRPCDGAIVRREYTSTQQAALRRESRRISISP
jgi:hypothetical protein